MGLLSIILQLMAGVGFLTFGFTRAVCGKPSFRTASGTVGNASVIIHGLAYDFSNFKHPSAGQTFNGNTNPLIQGGWGVAGNDISFMFQDVGDSCQGLIKKANTSDLPDGSTDSPGYYFPCNVVPQNNSAAINSTAYNSDTNCHLSSTARTQLAEMSPSGQVYYTWDMVANSDKNLAVFES